MKNIDIIIIEDNIEYSNIIKDFFALYSKKNPDGYVFNVRGQAFNGADGIRIINERKPDIVMLDLIMPNVDGIKVLQEVNKSAGEKKPVFVILSALSAERYKNLVLSEEIGAYFIKPTDFTVIAERIVQLMYNETVKYSLQKPDGGETYSDDIKDVIQKVGITPDLKGYHYLINCILLSLRHPEYLDGCLTKALYPETGKKFNTTGERVERSIRHAISKAWAGDSFSYFYAVADLSKEAYNHKPSNGFFISAVADYISHFR